RARIPVHRGWTRARMGLFRLDGSALARVLFREFVRSPLRPQAVRNWRPLQEQLGARLADDGRRVAQQSPPLSERRPARISLVADRPDLLRATAPRADGPRLGPARAAGERRGGAQAPA